MKKLLALVLALVMTLGLATVGANAAYADQDDINYEEAVDVMSAIGILGGDESGFRPADTLKRSEGAKIVAYLLLGNKAAEAIQATGTKYTDLPANHWAAGYMEYLSAVGVMGGIGDGKIDPDGQLTATAFAKMLLTALGYDAQIEGFGGPDWSINVQKIANKVGIFDGNRSVVGSNAVTREEAALYAFNTIQAPLVEYAQKGNTLTLNDATINFGASNAAYKTSTVLKNQTISDDVINNGSATATYITEFAEEYYPDLKLVGLGTSYNDFGQPVRKWTNANVAVGTYVLKEGLVKSWNNKVSRKDIYDTLGKDRYDAVKSGSANLGAVIDGLQVGGIVNGVSAVAGQSVDTYMNRSDTTAVNSTGNGSVTEVYSDENRNLIIVTYNTWVFQAAGDYNATNDVLTLKAAGDTNKVTEDFGVTGYAAVAMVLDDYRISGEDFPEVKDIKANDYLLVTAAFDETTNTYIPQTIEKAEIITGEVSGYKYDTTYNVTIGGETKSYSKMTSSANGNTKKTQYSVGQNAAVVLDKYGYIIAVDSAIVTNNYVFVTQFGSSNGIKSDAVASGVFTDGSTATLTLKAAYDYNAKAQEKSKTNIAGWKDDQEHINKWYTYSKDSSGQYTLYDIYGMDGQAGVSYAYNDTKADPIIKDAYVQYLGNNGKQIKTDTLLTNTLAKANDKTIMIVKDGKDVYSVYEGVKNIPQIVLTAKSGTTDAGSAEVYAAYKDGYASVVYVGIEGRSAISGSKNDNLVYVIGFAAEGRTKDNEITYEYTVLDLETQKAVTRAADSRIGNVGDKLYAVANFASVNSNDEMTNFEIVNEDPKGNGNNVVAGWKETADITYSNGTLNIGGNSYVVNSDSQITLVVLGDTSRNSSVAKSVGGLSSMDARAMNKDQYAGYVPSYNLTADTLATRFQNYTYTYNYVVRTTTDGDTIKELFVTVDQAAKVGDTPVAPTPASTEKEYVGLKRNGSNFTLYYYVPAGGAAAFNENDAEALMLDAGYTTASVTGLGAGTYTMTLGTITGVTVTPRQVYKLTVGAKYGYFAANGGIVGGTTDQVAIADTNADDGDAALTPLPTAWAGAKSSDATVITTDSATTNKMPTYDLTIYDTNTAAALTTLLAGTATISANTTVTGDVTIAGDVTFTDGATLTATNITVTGNVTGNGTLKATNAVTLDDDATGNLTTVDAQTVTVGCDLTVKTLIAPKIYLVGDDSNLTVTTALLDKEESGKAADVKIFIGYSENASGKAVATSNAVATLTVPKTATLGTVYANGDAEITDAASIETLQVADNGAVEVKTTDANTKTEITKVAAEGAVSVTGGAAIETTEAATKDAAGTSISSEKQEAAAVEVDSETTVDNAKIPTGDESGTVGLSEEEQKKVPALKTIASVARWEDGGEVFSADPSETVDWTKRLGMDLAETTIETTDYRYDAANKITYVSAEVTAKDRMTRHYNAAGAQGYWFGVSLEYVANDMYAMFDDADQDVTKLTYGDTTYKFVHWIDKTGSSGNQAASWYPNVTDDESTQTFYLAVRHGEEGSYTYTVYTVDFSKVATGVDYQFNFSGVDNAWSRQSGGEHEVVKIRESGKMVEQPE